MFCEFVTRTKPATDSRITYAKKSQTRNPSYLAQYKCDREVCGKQPVNLMLSLSGNPLDDILCCMINCPLTRIMEPIVEPLELTPSVSSSSKVTMISRFPDCKLSDRKAGSKGISEIMKVYIQSFAPISENQCLLQMLHVMGLEEELIKGFPDSNRYELWTKDSEWQSQSERRSQSNSE
ncbi:hypothetical protein Tco_0196708 [Tanacetum coccineum]